MMADLAWGIWELEKWGGLPGAQSYNHPFCSHGQWYRRGGCNSMAGVRGWTLPILILRRFLSLDYETREEVWTGDLNSEKY